MPLLRFLPLFLFVLMPVKLYSESWVGESKDKRIQVQEHPTINSLKEIHHYLKDTKETLIVFDVDYVLTHPTDSAYQFANFAQNMPFIKEMFLSLSPLQRDVFANLMVFDNEGSQLVETNSPDLISKLQHQGYKTVALTATLTSQLEKMDLKRDRIKILRNLGIDFSSSFPTCKIMIFDSLTPNRATYPLYLEGVLFSNGENQANQKGVVLKEFLKAIDFSPSHIVVIDDRKPNLDSICDAFKDSKIQVTGLHYKGSFLYPSKIVDRKAFEEKWQRLAKKAVELSECLNETVLPTDL